MKKIKVFIDGSHGTTGLRLEQRLAARDDIQLLKADAEHRRSPELRRRLINEADAAFLCLPDDAARESVSLCESDTVLIDTSTAHRTSPDWVYGFAELSEEQRAKIAASRRIAVPGCHAGGFVSIVYPLVKSGLMPADYPAVCHSLTGYSGGGKKMIAAYENEKNELMATPGQYGLSQSHKHLKEMQAVTGLAYAPVFVPIVDDYYSGMATTVCLHTRLLRGRADPETVREILARTYNRSALVRVLPVYGGEEPVGTIYAGEMSGSDAMKILVSGNAERVFITSVFDNLGKGASGAAVQCFNIAMNALYGGIEETKGLNVRF